jgi:hypothetical protein
VPWWKYPNYQPNWSSLKSRMVRRRIKLG